MISCVRTLESDNRLVTMMEFNFVDAAVSFIDSDADQAETDAQRFHFGVGNGYILMGRMNPKLGGN